MILNQNHKITVVIWNHDFKSNDFKSFPTLATRTDVYTFSFFPRTVNDWNSAPAEVRLKLSSPIDESLELFDWAMTPQR